MYRANLGKIDADLQTVLICFLEELPKKKNLLVELSNIDLSYPSIIEPLLDDRAETQLQSALTGLEVELVGFQGPLLYGPDVSDEDARQANFLCLLFSLAHLQDAKLEVRQPQGSSMIVYFDTLLEITGVPKDVEKRLAAKFGST